MKLTGWYRIGIVLSVLWCLFIIYHTIYEYDNPNEYNYLVTLKTDTIKSTPNDLLDGLPVDKLVINYGNIFLSMIVPVVIGWLLVLTSIWTIKWIVRGFSNKEPR